MHCEDGRHYVLIIKENSPFADSIWTRSRGINRGVNYKLENLLEELRSFSIEKVIGRKLVIGERFDFLKAIWFLEKSLETKEECTKEIIKSTVTEGEVNNKKHFIVIWRRKMPITGPSYDDPEVQAHHEKYIKEMNSTFEKQLQLDVDNMTEKEFRIAIEKNTLWVILWENALIKVRDGGTAKGLKEMKKSLRKLGVDIEPLIEKFEKEYKEWRKNNNFLEENGSKTRKQGKNNRSGY